MRYRLVKFLDEFMDLRGVKADLWRLLCAVDTVRRFFVFKRCAHGLLHIPPHLHTDLTWLDKPEDSLYMECAYCYLFAIFNKYPVLAGDCVYVVGASDLTGPIRYIVRSAWAASLRIGVLFLNLNYDTLVTNNYGHRLEDSKRQVFESDIHWPKNVSKEDSPPLDETFPVRCLPIGFEFELSRITVYYGVMA